MVQSFLQRHTILDMHISLGGGELTTEMEKYVSLSFQKFSLKMLLLYFPCHQTANLSRTLGNRTVDHSDVVLTLPAGTAPTTSSFST